MRYDSNFLVYAKTLIILLLCTLYLPFSMVDLYFGINSSEQCIIKKYEISMKDYLLLAGYSEMVLLFISVLIVLTPSRLITDSIIQLYYIIYTGIYTFYTIWNIIGMYIYTTYLYNVCNSLSEYILISLVSKFIFTIIIIGMLIN